MTTTVCKNTNQYLANIGVSYIKLHNLHWNVTGAQFKAVHEYLESLYDAYAGVLDEIAEIIRMNGQMPFASLEDYLSVATIDELKSREICMSVILYMQSNSVIFTLRIFTSSKRVVFLQKCGHCTARELT